MEELENLDAIACLEDRKIKEVSLEKMNGQALKNSDTCSYIRFIKRV